MIRMFLVLLLPLFVSGQSLAAVCSAECSLQSLVSEKVARLAINNSIEQTSTHQGCHSTKADSKNDKSPVEKNNCGSKICQFDELKKSDTPELATHTSLDNVLIHSQNHRIKFLEEPIQKIILTKSPPGFKPYLSVALYIQKSSYLI